METSTSKQSCEKIEKTDNDINSKYVIGYIDFGPRITNINISEYIKNEYVNPKFLWWGTFLVSVNKDTKIWKKLRTTNLKNFSIIDNISDTSFFVNFKLESNSPFVLINEGIQPSIVSIAELYDAQWYHFHEKKSCVIQCIKDLYAFFEKDCEIYIVATMTPLKLIKPIITLQQWENMKNFRKNIESNFEKQCIDSSLFYNFDNEYVEVIEKENNNNNNF